MRHRNIDARRIGVPLLSAATLGITLACVALAEDLPFPPPQSKICKASSKDPTQFVIDKDSLALYLTSKYPLSIQAVPKVVPATLSSLSTERRTLVQDLAPDLNNKLCTAATCSKSDLANLSSIRGYMLQLLAGSEEASFKPTAPVDPEQYFLGSNEDNRIICVRTPGGTPIEAPGAFFRKPDPASSQFRLRGKASDLYIDRSDQKDFAAASKATIDFTDNQVSDTTTNNMQAVLGYNLEVPIEGLKTVPFGRLDAIPYVGTNRKIVTISSSSKSKKPDNTDTADFGTLGSIYLVTGEETPFGHLINIRPDYLFNLEANSQLFTMFLQYVPALNGKLNSFRPVILGRDDIASFELMLDLRTDLGDYTDRGDRTTSGQNHNFAKLGGQGGVAVISDCSFVPADFSTTYTGMYTTGGNNNVGYLNTTVTLNLDPNKYFGINVSYLNGVREDTGMRDQQWEVSFSARY